MTLHTTIDAVWRHVEIVTSANVGVEDLPQWMAGGSSARVLAITANADLKSLTIQEPTSGSQPIQNLTIASGRWYPCSTILRWGGRVTIVTPVAAPIATVQISFLVCPERPSCEETT